MSKKIYLSFFVIISSLLFVKVTNASTASGTQALSHDQAIDLALNQSQETQSTVKSSDPIEIPDWLKRTNFAIEAGTDQKTDYFFETVQPLLGTQDKDVVFFNQSRITETGGRPAYNIGFGLRKIFADSYLLGINSFYDYQDLHRHSRAGVGFEAIGDRGLEGRINTYIGISHRRLVQEDASNFYYEKVANGFDWELGGPLPYLPFLKVYGGGNWYNFEHFNNQLGWQARMEFTPVKYTRLDFTVLHDNKSRDIDFRFEGAVTLAFTSFSLHDIINDIKGSSAAAYPKINLRDKVLDRVVRDFDITVIKSTKSKTTGLTVEEAEHSLMYKDLKNYILIGLILIFSSVAFAATGPATVYKVKVTKFELYNGTSWVTVNGTSSTLDIASASSGKVAGNFFSGLAVPDGTYTQCRATPAASFIISGNVGSNYTKSTNGPDGGCAMGTASQQGECTVTASTAPGASTKDFSATPIIVVNGSANHKVRVSFDVSTAVQTITGSDTEIYPAEPTVTMSVQ